MEDNKTFDNYFEYALAKKFPDIDVYSENVERPKALPEQNLPGEIATGAMQSFKSDVQENPVESLYAIAKGGAAGGIGALGDVVSLIKGVGYALSTPEGKSAVDEFIKGMESATVVPTTEDVQGFLNQFIPEPKTQAAETAGELIAPVKLGNKFIKTTVKKMTKAKK